MSTCRAMCSVTGLMAVLIVITGCGGRDDAGRKKGRGGTSPADRTLGGVTTLEKVFVILELAPVDPAAAAEDAPAKAATGAAAAADDAPAKAAPDAATAAADDAPAKAVPDAATAAADDAPAKAAPDAATAAVDDAPAKAVPDAATAAADDAPAKAATGDAAAAADDAPAKAVPDAATAAVEGAPAAETAGGSQPIFKLTEVSIQGQVRKMLTVHRTEATIPANAMYCPMRPRVALETAMQSGVAGIVVHPDTPGKRIAVIASTQGALALFPVHPPLAREILVKPAAEAAVGAMPAPADPTP